MPTKKQGGKPDRRWWIKLETVFFTDTRTRAIRRRLGANALILYQRIMLKSLPDGCFIRFAGFEDSFEEEIAISIDEDSAEDVALIKQLFDYLIAHDLMIEQPDQSYFLPQAKELSGGEGQSAEWMRNKRERDAASQGDKMESQYDDEPPQSDKDESQSNNASQCDDSESHFPVIRTRTITDSNLKRQLDLDLNLEQDTDTGADADSVSADPRAASAAAKAAAPREGDLFSVAQLKATVTKNKVNLAEEGVEAFHEEMQGSGWVLYQKPVEKKSIVKALRGWAKFHPEYHPEEERVDEGKSDFEEEDNGEWLKEIIGEKETPFFLYDSMSHSILAVAREEYVSNKRYFGDKSIKERAKMVQRYCPREAFTEKQLYYMSRVWHVQPQSASEVEVDEYLGEEDE